jgi:ATP phosphoribosyltransferase regulatory subunit
VLLHPLPAGMRDLLPTEARRQSALGRRVMAAFELFGFERVTLPAFEYADVLEKGLGALDANEVLRFVEPETGEVVALRPDMTPQVARLLATRLADAPVPARLCYEGSVLRRRRERARRHRQIPQAGIELLGSEGPTGDLEVLSVATAAVRSAGLEQFTLDLGHVRVAASLLEGVPAEHFGGLVEALAVKDDRELVRRGERAGLGRGELEALAALPALHGSGDELWKEAERVLGATPAAEPLSELRALWQVARDRELAPKLVIDLGETWNFNYYTGVMFQILAEGPGAAVGSGGRYDGLLARFGMPRAAAGFAVDLDNLGWALAKTGPSEREPARVLVSGDANGVLGALREAGIRCAAAPATDALSYAEAWRYSHWLDLQKPTAALVSVADRSRTELDRLDPGQLVARLRKLLG